MIMRRVNVSWAVAAMALFVAGLGGVAVARAQQGADPGGACQRGGGLLTGDDRAAIGQVMFNRVKEKLGLGDQQAEEIRASLKAVRQDARADFQSLCEARAELRRLLEQQDSGPAAVKAAGERVKAIQGKLLDRRLDAYVALRGNLTPDQWAKWVELRKEMGQRFMGPFRPRAL